MQVLSEQQQGVRAPQPGAVASSERVTDLLLGTVEEALAACRVIEPGDMLLLHCHSLFWQAHSWLLLSAGMC